MKKRIASVFIAIIMVLSSIPIFCHATYCTQTNGSKIQASLGTVGADPTATYNANDEYAVMSVDVEWESMNFKYSFGDKWDPASHSYVSADGSPVGWNKNTANIIVTNNSNCKINAAVSFTRATTAKGMENVNADFDKNEAVIDSSVGKSAGVTEIFTLSISGEPTQSAKETSLGVAEIFIKGVGEKTDEDTDLGIISEYAESRDINVSSHTGTGIQIITSGNADLLKSGKSAHICTKCCPSCNAPDNAPEHNYGAWKTIKHATCSQTGEKQAVCLNCGNITKMQTGTISHCYVVHTVNPTCTSEGYTVYTCTECGQTRTGVKIKATGHSDKNNDGACDSCHTRLGSNTSSKSCDCACHKSGLDAIKWKIKVASYKLLGKKEYRYCKCGNAHW